MIDILLGYGVLTAGLAHVNAFRVPPGHVQDRPGDQAIVEHHIGLLHQAQGLEGQQIGIPRARADQKHFADRVRSVVPGQTLQ